MKKYMLLALLLTGSLPAALYSNLLVSVDGPGVEVWDYEIFDMNQTIADVKEAFKAKRKEQNYTRPFELFYRGVKLQHNKTLKEIGFNKDEVHLTLKEEFSPAVRNRDK